MKTLAVSFAALAILAPNAEAQRQGRQGRGNMMARIVGPMLANAADADQNKAITEKEWKAFVDSVTGKKGIDVNKVKLAVLGSTLDLDGDKKLTAKDFAAAWKRLDRNKDGEIKAEELAGNRRGGQGNRRRRGGNAEGGAGEGNRRRRGGDAGGAGEGRGRRNRGAQGQGRGRGGEQGQGGGRRARGGQEGGARGDQARNRQRNANRNRYATQIARMFATAADADANGSVTKDEWKKMVEGFKANDDGVYSTSTVAAMLMAKGIKKPEAKPAEGAEGEGEGRGRGRGRNRNRMGRGGNFLSMIDRGLDADRSGSVDAKDFDAIWKALDADESGTIEAKELQGRNRNRRRR